MTTETVARKGRVVKVRCGEGYAPSAIGRIIAKVTDTGNGYIAKFPAYSSTEQDHYVCLDYSEAHALWMALGEFYKKQGE